MATIDAYDARPHIAVYFSSHTERGAVLVGPRGGMRDHSDLERHAMQVNAGHADQALMAIAGVTKIGDHPTYLSAPICEYQFPESAKPAVLAVYDRLPRQQ